MSALVPPTGFEPALTAPEAAWVPGHGITLACAKAAGVRKMSTNDSGLIPDHGRIRADATVSMTYLRPGPPGRPRSAGGRSRGLLGWLALGTLSAESQQ
jgi:hypothetical protein